MTSALILIPLLSAALGAVANVMGKWLADDIRPRPFAAWSFIGIFLWITPFAAASFHLTVAPVTLMLLAAVVLIDTGANYFYFKALDTVEVSDVSALGALAPLFTTMFALLFLPATVTGEAVLAGVAITAAVYTLNVDRDALLAPLTRIRRSRQYYPLLSGVLFGLSAIPVKLLLTTYGAANPATLYWLRAGLITVLFIAVFRPPLRGHGQRLLAWVGLRAGVIAISWLLFYLAIQQLNVVIAVALAYTTPMFTLLIANRRLGETITVRRLIAISIILGTIVLVRGG